MTGLPSIDIDHLDEVMRSHPDQSQLIEQIKKIDKNIIQIDPSIYDDVQRLCQYWNVPYLRASGEADALCAKLYEMGLVQGIMSEDSDILLYKGGRLIRKFTWFNEIEVVDLNQLLSNLSITYQQFIDLSILCGTDYTNETIKGLGPVKALEMIRSGLTIEQIIEKLAGDSKYQIPEPDAFPYEEVRHLIQSAHLVETPEQLHLLPMFDFNKIQLDQFGSNDESVV